MPALMIRDLACSKALDRKAMASVRGGLSLSGPFVNLQNVGNVSVNQNIFAVQLIDVDVLNNSVIGAGFNFRMNLDVKQPLRNVVNI